MSTPDLKQRRRHSIYEMLRCGRDCNGSPKCISDCTKSPGFLFADIKDLEFLCNGSCEKNHSAECFFKCVTAVAQENEEWSPEQSELLNAMQSCSSDCDIKDANCILTCVSRKADLGSFQKINTVEGPFFYPFFAETFFARFLLIQKTGPFTHPKKRTLTDFRRKMTIISDYVFYIYLAPSISFSVLGRIE